MHQSAFRQPRWLMPIKRNIQIYLSSTVSAAKCNLNPNGIPLFPSNVCVTQGSDVRWFSNRTGPTVPYNKTLLHRTHEQTNLGCYQMKRSIFSDGFLEMDRFQQTRNSYRLKLGDVAVLRSRMSADFEQSGLKNVFAADVIDLVDLAETTEDLILLSKILKASLEDNNRTLPDMSNLLHMFFSVCKIHGNRRGYDLGT